MNYLRFLVNKGCLSKMLLIFEMEIYLEEMVNNGKVVKKDECEGLFDELPFEKRKRRDIYFGLKVRMEILGNIFHF